MTRNIESTSDTLIKINSLQRRIIVASIVYYELDNCIMSDYQYDSLVKQLKKLMDDYPEKEQSRYWYVYKDWTGASGFFLYYHLNFDDQCMLLESAKCAVEDIMR